MPMPVHPTIVVPGITASYLTDEYPLPPDVVWSVLTRGHERISLHPDDLRYEAVEPSRVVAGQVFEVAYRELIEELRHNLRPREDLPVPVFAFPYDWRQPLVTSCARLGAFIDEVIARTRLLRHYDSAGYGNDPKVNLIGHSMGGLVIAGYLARAAGKARVHKVATLATPFQGSFEAVARLATGTADLGTGTAASREREAARLTPALYQLLPGFAEGIHPAGASLFDPASWQPSVLATIEEYIRLRGLVPRGRRARARELFTALLEAAAEERRLTNGLDLAASGLDADRWLCIVGVDARTRVALTIERPGSTPEFVFRSGDRQNQWSTGRTPEERRRTGDGTVPFVGAVPSFLRPENLVCVSPADYGYWELQDRALSAVSGFHGILPNMDMLHRMLVAHLSDRPPRHDNAWGRLAPGVDAPAWPGSLAAMRVRS
jgi:pimeloyl-ACP methyl ester carboxylesterase